jgi:hypothetical protein
MKTTCAPFSRILIVAVALTTGLGFALLMWGQEVRPIGAPRPSPGPPAEHSPGVPWDWTHHHVVFSHPGTAEEALRNGTYDRWLAIANDPRYIIQQLKRSGAGAVLPAAPQDPAAEVGPGIAADLTDEADAATQPAAPMTEEDFPSGVLPRGLARALIPPPAPQSELVPESLEAAARKPPPKRKNRFHKDWSETEGNNGTTGLGVFPATVTSTSASCTTDFAVFNTGLAGSSSQASIIAFNELYSSCAGPATYWAYNTGGTIVNSVVLSLDGTQVAFLQSNSSGVASLVVLKWASGGTLTSPTTLTSNSSYPNCTAPCMISLTLSGSPSDTYSSPFIAYGPGGTPSTIYVGDDAGQVHNFANIFSTSTPAEVGSPWPVTLNTSTDAALGSPVYDATSGKIFIGDYLANTSSSCQPGISTPAGQCGYLYSINASSGAVVQSAQLDYNLGIYDSPIVDSSTGMVYAFIGADNSTNCSSGPCAAVFQFPVGFSAGAGGTEATVGAGYEFLMSGSFDNQYFTSTNFSSPSGHLYVVGGTGPQNNTLYAITFTNGSMSTTATAGPVVATNYTNNYYAAGLQVTEFCNNGAIACTATTGTDYLFLGVLGFGSQFGTNPCPSQSLSVGCIMGFTAPASGTVSSSATPNGVLSETGGTSGIVVDNGAAGASNIYFSTLLNQSCTGGTGGCAVSATQAALD